MGRGQTRRAARVARRRKSQLERYGETVRRRGGGRSCSRSMIFLVLSSSSARRAGDVERDLEDGQARREDAGVVRQVRVLHQLVLKVGLCVRMSKCGVLGDIR